MKIPQYRLWDRKEKRMKVVVALEWDMDNPNNGLIEIHTYPLAIYKGGYRKDLGYTRRLIEDTELLEKTGLKDKNGKEIYEGDIVRYQAVGGEIITTIQWDERWLWLKLKDDDPVHFNFSSGFECEVIGNIYENGDLLK